MNTSWSKQLLHPKYLGSWIFIAVVYLASQLPLRLSQYIGRFFGRCLAICIPKRKHITKTNLALCFPTLAAPAQKRLCKETYDALGQGIIEAGMAWWSSRNRLLKYTHIDGFEHFLNAQKQGKGVILLSAHFTTMELTAQLLGHLIDNITLMQRHQNNPIINYFMGKNRAKNMKTIYLHDLLPVKSALKRKETLLIAPDQDRGKEKSIFVPFMGIPTATVTSIHRFSKFYQSPVVPVVCFKSNKKPYFQLTFYPELSDFPSACPIKDSEAMNRMLSHLVRIQPKLYLWCHRRFKTRPEHEKSIY